MKVNRVVVMASAAAVLGFLLSASPALARQDDHRRGSTSTHTQPARPSSQPAPQAVPRTQAAPRNQAPPQSNTSRAPERLAPQGAPRGAQPQPAPRVETPRQSTPQRNEAPRYTAPQQRFEAPRQNAPQRPQAPRYEAPRYTSPQRYEAPRYAAPRHEAPRYTSRFTHEPYRPYYTFRRHLSIGIGFFLGYPVAFPSWYSYPYGSGYAPGYISAGPAYGGYGGLSLEINPSDAEVFIDGEYAGVVADFAPTEQPLTLSAGRHRIELRAPGFLTQTFDITVMAGQVLPLQGAMVYR